MGETPVHILLLRSMANSMGRRISQSPAHARRDTADGCGNRRPSRVSGAQIPPPRLPPRSRAAAHGVPADFPAVKAGPPPVAFRYPLSRNRGLPVCAMLDTVRPEIAEPLCLVPLYLFPHASATPYFVHDRHRLSGLRRMACTPPALTATGGLPKIHRYPLRTPLPRGEGFFEYFGCLEALHNGASAAA